jgi:hypothetical protein
MYNSLHSLYLFYSTPYTFYTPYIPCIHTSSIPCMIAISAYWTGYSGVQRYTVAYSSVSSAFSALCTTSELFLLLSHLLLSITALPKDCCLPDIAVTVSIRSDQQCCESSPSIPRYLHCSLLPMYNPLSPPSHPSLSCLCLLVSSFGSELLGVMVDEQRQALCVALLAGDVCWGKTCIRSLVQLGAVVDEQRKALCVATIAGDVC